MARWPAIASRMLGVALAAWGCLSPGDARAQEAVVGSPTLIALEGETAAYPNGTFAQQLSAASQGGDGPVGGPKYRPGAGRRDDWLVGPHWRVTVDGVVLFRDNSNLDAIIGVVEADPIAGDPLTLEFRDNFDHAAGARVLLTSEFPQCAGYELQVGYLGADKWTANAYWEEFTVPAASLPLSDIDVQQRRQLVYDSSLHSAEINFQRLTRGYLKPFAGLRYIALDESVFDANRQYTNVILGDPDITTVGDSLSSAIAQQSESAQIDNNLIGFQGGLRLDMWRPTRRLHVSGFFSAGVYCNIIDRDRVSSDSTSITTKEVIDNGTANEIQTTTNSLTTTAVTSADGTRIAFTTEAALAATWRLSSTTALRAGYQVQFLDGIELAENLWTAPPPITPVRDDLFLHGWFAGLEYRR